MKRMVALAAIVILLLGGCAASVEEMAAYHSAMKSANDAIIASVNQQTSSLRTLETTSMAHYSAAMVNAAKTTSQTDDVILAFAWGAWTATKRTIEIPQLQYPKAPVTDVDRIRAWTPMVGVVSPLLTPLIYGLASSGDGSSTRVTYQATDDAEIHVGSYNPGQYSAVGGDQSTLVDRSYTECADCGTEDGDLGINPVTGDPEDGSLQTCLTEPPGGYSSSGTPMYNTTLSCSTYYGS